MKWIIVFSLFICLQYNFGQSPVIKVDLNQIGRPESEVNEPGYLPWPVPSENSITTTIDGVKITFTRIGTYGTGLEADWYKAGVQYPINAKLANDGLTVENGDVGGQIEMRISGLPAGNHTLQTFHNTYSNPASNTFSPIDIYLNGSLEVDDLMPSNRVTSNIDMASVYFHLTAVEGEDIVLLFATETSSTASKKNVTISGFEINTPNVKSMANLPCPEDGDEHVDADSGSITLSWLEGLNAIQHNIYFGTSEEQVEAADTSSDLFLGSQADTFFTVRNLYSMETYYWRVDEINTEGDTIKGRVWYFRPRQLAFPDAEGYGRFARGGRGGQVFEVTNLNDDGAGSLRQAVEVSTGTPKIIVFRISGVIYLKSRLTVKGDYITVAGQTAPGKGICIARAPFGLSGANDIIMQNIRVRVGSGYTYDGMGMAGSNHCIFDHCSISWTIDEGFSSREAQNITLQRTLISEPLNVAGHTNYEEGYPHGFAGSISGDIGSFHHNLLAHCFARNWSLAGGLDGNGVYAGRLDIFNNVVYNWSARTNEGGAHEVNFVGNYYKPGAAMNDTANHALMAEYDNFPGTQRYYFSGNVMPGYFDESNQDDGKIYYGTPNGYSPWVDKPFFPSYATIQSATDAYKSVLSDVGATQPVFDEHDQRIVEETKNGTYTYSGSVSGLPGIIDAHADAGGWEEYPLVLRDENWDSDHDGLPDWWETIHDLDPNSVSDDYSETNADDDRDGYTNMDNYLYWLSKPHFTTGSEQEVFINLEKLSTGYQDNPDYLITDVTNAIVDIQNNKWARFVPGESGLASFKFKVTDAEGSSITQEIGVHVAEETKVELDTLIQFVTDDTTKIPVSFISQKQSDFNISIYPNPGTDNIVLHINSSPSLTVRVDIYNPLGKLVMRKKHQLSNPTEKIHMEIKSFEPGLYFISVSDNQSQRIIKFIKN